MPNKKDFMRLSAVVRRVFLEDWDPIGLFQGDGSGAPEDEYDSYIPGTIKLLFGGAEEEALAKHLSNIARVSMGLSPGEGQDARARRTAARLKAEYRRLFLDVAA